MTQTQPPITSRTGIFGVIGSPIEHSLSPILHNYVLSRLGLDYRYLAFQISREDLAGLGTAIRTLGIKGLNVTLPHKEAVAAQVDELTDEARRVGAVNTIGVGRDGRLVGHNTDTAGFLNSLRIRGLDQELKNRGAVLLGAGGAARAILCCLVKLGAEPIHLVNRTVQRAEELAGWCRNFVPEAPVQIVPGSEEKKVGKAVSEAFITVNVTPLGMAPDVQRCPLSESILPRAGTVVYDTIYNPLQTLLLKRASAAGCRVIGGLDMLIIQGMESLAWWLESPVPWQEMIDDLRNLLQNALGEKEK